jgi:hypothetical protein
LARAARELVGEDGMALVQLWWEIARDETRRDSDRLEASRLLADRGWGKAASFEPVEGDPLLPSEHLESRKGDADRRPLYESLLADRPALDTLRRLEAELPDEHD